MRGEDRDPTGEGRRGQRPRSGAEESKRLGKCVMYMYPTEYPHKIFIISISLWS